MSKVTELHVISHTHWDREWYLTFQQFRLRLVDLIEHLLAIMDRDPEYEVKKDNCRENGLPLEMSFFKLEPEELIISALKKYEEDDSVILRFYNIDTKTVRAKLHCGQSVKEAFLANLNEENKSVLEINQGQIRPFKVGPNK